LLFSCATIINDVVYLGTKWTFATALIAKYGIREFIPAGCEMLFCIAKEHRLTLWTVFLVTMMAGIIRMTLIVMV
jgi:hypothetical protein